MTCSWHPLGCETPCGGELPRWGDQPASRRWSFPERRYFSIAFCVSWSVDSVDQAKKNARGAERLQQVQCGYFTWVCPPGIGNEVWPLVLLVRDKLPLVPNCSAFHHCSSYGFLGKLAICFIVSSFSILSWPCFTCCSYQSLDKTKQGAELCDPMLRCFVWKV